MSNHPTNPEDHFLTRRELLHACGVGLGTLAFAELFKQSAIAGEQDFANPLAVKQPHFQPKVKRIIHLFMNGGPSHVDTFDPKPMLTKYDGKPLPIHLKTERKTGVGFGSPYKFQQYGQSGIEVSELYPNVAGHVDDLCIIRSMRTDLPNHEPSLLMMNCGDLRQIRPSFGSWLTYGLGTENQNLPGFIVLCPYGYPVSGTQNWTSGFLPSVYQGTYIDTKETQVERLIQHIKNSYSSRAQQRKQLDLLASLNQRYQKQRQEDSLIEAQIQSYELAFRMQAEATDAFDVSKEPEHIRRMYGETVYGRQVLMGRRLLERGVRFVQIWQGKDQPWDNHEYLVSSHKQLAQATDKPIAALLTDLKERGMLDDTLVIWGGEFGRTPVVELTGASGGANKADWGRDHNNHGFTMWLAGGGVKKGYVYGSTDEFGFAAAEKPIHVHDLHATLLHLLGFDHERLTYRYAGRDFRLTDVQGVVIEDLLA
jgi:phage FluMu protein gp41